MKKNKIKPTKLIIVILLLGFSFGVYPEEKNSDVADLVIAQSRFGFKLIKALASQEGEGNIIISPLSIFTALGMTYNGADGKTAAAMAETLEVQDMSLGQLNQANSRLLERLKILDTKIDLLIANSLWADTGLEFKPDFLSLNQEFYAAGIFNLRLSDPASLIQINKWIENETRGRVKKPLARLDPDTILLLVNTIAFKGDWTVGFKPEDTGMGDFYLAGGVRKKIPFMLSQSNRYTLYEGKDFTALGIPYGQEKVSIYLFLPDAGSDLKRFLQQLDLEKWQTWLKGFRPELVKVVLPRIRSEYKVQLNKTLAALGMEPAFSDEANFIKMAFGGAAIDEVIHQSYLAINEEGTEAGAATVVKMKKGNIPQVVFNRPFLFAIRDNNSGTILFMGTIQEPQHD